MIRQSPFLPSLAGRRSRGPILAGTAIIAGLVGGFGIWAAMAPLARGAVAAAQVVAEGHRKSVQHLEGGIVADILVRDGDLVTAGQPLIRLDGSQAQARMAALMARHDAMAARIARLDAEQRDRATITFPAEIATTEILAVETELFMARRQSRDAELDLIEQKRREEADRIKGLDAQLAATRDQIRLTRDELADQRQLLDKGFTRRPRVLDLERRAAELAGRAGSLTADIALARVRVVEAGIEAIRKRNAFQESVLSDLRAAQDETARLDKELEVVGDILTRLDIRATETGAVHDLRVRTIGGVIAPGEALLEIVPTGGGLIIEARVVPTDIEHVAVGTPAEVRFPGLPQRTTPTVAGTVITVSPDVMTDRSTGQPHYLARVRIAESERARLGGVAIHPGMPAEAILISGERTALEYLLEPLTAALARSFKE